VYSYVLVVLYVNVRSVVAVLVVRLVCVVVK